MRDYKAIFTTERGQRHQQAALTAAPDYLDITMLRQPDKATLMSHLAEAEYLISERTGEIDAEMIKAAAKLKLILRLGGLTYDIDTTAAQAAGVIVCYWPVGTVIRVAEHIMMQMLILGKKLREIEAIALAASDEWGPSRRTDEDTFAYNWSNRQTIGGLWQQTVGIMGLGEIGAELARRLKGWDCPVLYHKRRRLPLSVEQELGLTYVDNETLFRQSDYLVNLLPYFKATDMLINANFVAKMKDGAFIASCGSGSVIDEAALADALKSGKLAGVALDTYEWEPIKAENPLIALAKAGYNVLLTPHTAAGDSAAATQERSGDYTTIINHIQQQPLKYRVV
jgi:phosphoglycerate dehydrogenase-like enzyme